MNKTLSIIVCITFSCCSYAQDGSVKHIIERGETLSSIAGRYGVSTDKIIELNPDASDFIYVGMELDIPGKSSSSLGNSIAGALETIKQLELLQDAETVSAACEEADRLLDAGQNGKAIKAYNEVLKKYASSGYSCVDAYYGRGIAYYNQGKWKSAIKDFESAISDSGCTEAIQSHCTTLLADARNYRQEQLKERGEMWGSLLTTAAVVTTRAIAANQQAKNAKRSSSGASHAGTSQRYNYGNVSNHSLPQLDPYLMDNMVRASILKTEADMEEQNRLVNSMVQASIQKAEADVEAQYQQAKAYNPNLTREEFTAIMAQAYQEVNNAELGESLFSTNNSYNDTYSYSSHTTSTDCPSLKLGGNLSCGNTGICGMCGGDGLMDSPFSGHNSLPCTLCENQSGKCRYCNK